MSQSEPELGIGTILAAAGDTANVLFPATGTIRQYAIATAPLKRVQFRPGDRIRTHDERSFTIQDVREENGLFTYCGEGIELPESQLSDFLSFSQPLERFLVGQLDPTKLFDLRQQSLQHQFERRKSAVRGFVGARIELIPHQLYIANEVASRPAPRVLLADEVGLGKTIEACLIAHRLIATGRAARVLILVPEALIHQWFVELLRRFNLHFSIFDEERCDAIETNAPEANPFMDEQFVLCSLRFATQEPRRPQQLINGNWDLLIVDEAHHLEWSETGPGQEYQLVDELSRKTSSVLLLTGTPEQLGQAGHFARLRLLDPDRYSNLANFLAEATDYQTVARIADKLIQGTSPTEDEKLLLNRFLGQPAAGIDAALKEIARGNTAKRDQLVQDLVDRHGPGRVMFRNRRTSMAGFPKRVPQLAPLASSDPELAKQLRLEWEADLQSELHAGAQYDFRRDPRLDWLVQMLRKLKPEKILLICRFRQKAEAIAQAIQERINTGIALFHENLAIIQRDRNAAWFAEEDGAQILICSEIGSEGRNFQFAHHLVLFDLPLNPELLEQRIGRLDRIGQSQDIKIHLPFVIGTPQEALVRWYHEGLNAIERHIHGSSFLQAQFADPLNALARSFSPRSKAKREKLQRLIEQTQQAAHALQEELEHGRDRLLELNSFNPEHAEKVANAIRQLDEQQTLDDYMLAVFDHYGIHVEELGNRTHRLGSGGVFTDAFPALPADGALVTLDRSKALAREEISFLTWDHPMVTGALDLILGSPHGNCAFALLESPDHRILLAEMFFVFECLAPSTLHLDRFLPATPIRVVINHQFEECTEAFPPSTLASNLKDIRNSRLLETGHSFQNTVRKMLKAARALAERKTATLSEKATAEIQQQLGHEIERLTALQKVNPNVRSSEITALEEQRTLLQQHIEQSTLRLDCFRLIWHGPADLA